MSVFVVVAVVAVDVGLYDLSSWGIALVYLYTFCSPVCPGFFLGQNSRPFLCDENNRGSHKIRNAEC